MINIKLKLTGSKITMKKKIRILFLVVIFLFSTNGFLVFGEFPGNPALLVSPEWLNDQLEDPSIIIFHVGKKVEYEEKHIPGAHLFPAMEIFLPPGELNHEIPTVEKLEKVFRPFGISKESVIILYYSEDWVTVAARAYLTLDHIGLGDQTSILDGGLAQWINEERIITSDIPETSENKLKLQTNKDVLADVNWVKENLMNPDVVLVDGRPEEFYDGSEKEEHIEKYGHIEGAVSIPFMEIMQAESAYKFRSKEELQKLFADAGIMQGSTVIAYCNTGVWASLVYFTAKYLGYNTRFYDGSFEEWTKDDSLPVTEPVGLKN